MQLQQTVRIKSFTTSYSGLSNVLKNDVYITEAFDLSKNSNFEKMLKDKFTAIWDTGATNSVISQKIVDQCNLKPIGVAEVHSPGGSFKTNKYLINLFLPNYVAIPYFMVIKGQITGDANVLIGMDIISNGDFAVTNKDNKTVFTFRIPSVVCIDFVKDYKEKSTNGRNEPLP